MQGEKVSEFERMFCEYTGAKYAVAVSSGTAALHLSLISSGISENDEVICPSLSFIATANSIKFVNAKPVFCDVMEKNVIISPDNAELLISENTKAIMPVHQLGFACDIEGFRKITHRHNLLLIEDAACAIGSEYYGKRIGSDSFIACFSFHPRKIVTTGEGGMVVTNSAEILETVRSLRNHGKSDNHYILHGYNYRMTDIQAAVGLIQLSRINNYLQRNREIARIYDEFFKSDARFEVVREQKFSSGNYQSYIVYLNESSGLESSVLVSRLNEYGIMAQRGITAIHKQPAYSVFNSLVLENTEKMEKNTILLPIYYGLNDNELEYILNIFKKIKN